MKRGQRPLRSRQPTRGTSVIVAATSTRKITLLPVRLVGVGGMIDEHLHLLKLHLPYHAITC